jgi:hypothetical protein
MPSIRDMQLLAGDAQTRTLANQNSFQHLGVYLVVLLSSLSSKLRRQKGWSGATVLIDFFNLSYQPYVFDAGGSP